MSLIKTIAEKLGLKWDDEMGESEKFEIHKFTYNPHKLTNDGLFNKYGDSCDNGLNCLVKELATIKKLPFIPEIGEMYYTPDVSETDKYFEFINLGDSVDEIVIERGLAFRTKEEAIAMANKMLEVVKNEV